MNVEVLYTKNANAGDDDEEIVQGHFTLTQEIHNVNEIEPIMDVMVNRLKDAITEAQLRESGWRFVKIKSKKLVINKYKNNSGGSYIPLPFSSSNIINIQNNDQLCFLWSVIAHLHPAQNHKERVSHYNKTEYKNELDLTGGLDEFPYDYNKLTKFHKKNKHIIEVNVFELTIKYIPVGNISDCVNNGKNFYLANKNLCQAEIEYNERSNYMHHKIIYQGEVICLDKREIKKTLTPIMINHNNYKSSGEQVNILYYKGHYMLCKDISIFTRTSDNTTFPCLQCMTSFSSEQALKNHLNNCQENEAVRNTFPKEDYLKFNKWFYKNKVPFTIYCDFEAYNVIGNNEKEQKPLCWGMYIHSNYPELFKSTYYQWYGEDSSKKFTETIEHLQNHFSQLLKTNNPIQPLTYDEDIKFQNEKTCYYCGKELVEDKVKDHDHLNGLYRGAAHNSCNLNANKFRYNFVPLYFYNGSKYDFHLIVKDLFSSETLQKLRINILCKTEEEYFSMQFGCIRILDAFRFFTPYSLGFMGKTLKSDQCKILTSYNLKPLKGIYPYEYLTGDINRINEIMQEQKLPSYENFYSSLKQSNITKDDYAEAEKNWKELNCNTMYDYTMKYLQIDVLILADLFENFRDMCTDYYGIDPCYCYSSPGLTWLAGLKHTGVKLKHYKENTYDKLLFFESGIRGGVSSVLGNRYVKCYNKKVEPENYGHMKEITSQEEEKLLSIFSMSEKGLITDDEKNQKFDEFMRENYLLYYDFNSLYSSCMIQELPTGEMEWCHDLSYERTYDNGFVYEVDLEYPDEIKDTTKYYPFCPENKTPKIEDFTEYQKSIMPKNYRPSKKLMLTQSNKEKYVVEGRMLDWYLDHGMILTKVHRKLTYEKSKWLKNYIEFNIEKRKEAKRKKDDFGNVFFKLMNNAFYGKTLENVRNRQNIEIVYNNERFQNLTRKPTYKRTTRFSDNLCAMHLRRSIVKHDKFNYIGFTILELAKMFMYKFIYDYLAPAYGENYKLHFSDTDSVFLELTIPFNSSLEAEIDKIKDIIHPSDLCKVKDELNEEFITEAVFLKAKCYCYESTKKDTKRENKTLKGISKASIANQITFQDYKNVLFTNQIKNADNYRLNSNKHRIYLKEENKLALDPFDDKRRIQGDGITTLPY